MSDLQDMPVGEMPPGARYTIGGGISKIYTILFQDRDSRQTVVEDDNKITLRIRKDTVRSMIVEKPAAAAAVGGEPQEGPIIESGDFWAHDTDAWHEFTVRVVNAIDEFGAWYMMGMRPDADIIVIDVLRPTLELMALFRRKNIRTVQLWRLPS